MNKGSSSPVAANSISGYSHMKPPNCREPLTILFALLFLTLPSNVAAQRTKLKPGMNSFSPEQDIQLGKQAAGEAEKKIPMCNDPKVDAYLTKLGMSLVAHLNTGGIEYPWEFHCVNDKAVNAFALPGGYVFVNRGAIEAADYEAELAGVMAHELSHVALRHGTNQATKAQYAQLGTGILGVAGGIFGGTAGAAAAGIGQFAAGSVLLKYSRGAETQADVMGTQVLYDAGYDPRAMAAFFEKLGAESTGKNPPEFFSDHPNPDHRVERVDEEIQKLGGPPEGAKGDSAEFEAIKREVIALPVVKKEPFAAGSAAKSGTTPHAGSAKVADPSRNYAGLAGEGYSLKYPDNWKEYGTTKNVTLAPEGGVVDSGKGQGELVYGVMASIAKLEGQAPVGSDALNAATQKLLEALQQENANMKVIREPRSVNLNGKPGLSTFLENDSPLGGREIDWVVTVMRPEGLVYFVCVAPQGDYQRFQKSFSDVLNSVRFAR
jgi:beta-barrel assembly-enhancing protease